MKYFTPDLIERFGSLDDDVADAAAVEWEEAVTRHEKNLHSIRADLSASLCHLWDNFYLHDAQVLSMGHQLQTFVIVLRLDTPPHDLLVLNYHLSEEPAINTAALPPEQCSTPLAWMYDEVDIVPGNKNICMHSILFSNGWEVQLRFRDMQVIAAQPVVPVCSTPLVPGVPQSV